MKNPIFRPCAAIFSTAFRCTGSRLFHASSARVYSRRAVTHVRVFCCTSLHHIEVPDDCNSATSSAVHAALITVIQMAEEVGDYRLILLFVSIRSRVNVTLRFNRVRSRQLGQITRRTRESDTWWIRNKLTRCQLQLRKSTVN